MCWSNKAFTLLEILLAIVIVGCLTGAIAGMLVASLETEDIGRVESDLGAEFAVGFSRLMGDLRDAARLYECTPTSVGLTQWAGLMVGTPKGVFLFDWRSRSWFERNGGVMATAIRSIFSEETGLILAGGADGCIYKTSDCGRSWEKISVGSGAIVGIARASDGTLFCLQESPPAVYKSDDEGATWVSCAALPDAPPNAHALLCRKDSVIVGTDWNGYGNIYYSDDGGASWQVCSAIWVPPATWMYRRRVDIRNNSSQNLINYQVRIVVPFEQGKMRPDFGDIRFKSGRRPTDPDLPYWLEYYDSKQAIFWVKVPRLRARRRTRIWLFYGNPDATSLSDINATMEPAYQVYTNYPSQPPAPSNLLLTSGGSWVTLPFDFPFWREFKNRTYACYYGYLLFDPTTEVVDSSNSTPEFRQRCMVAGFWDYGRQLYSTDGTYYQTASDNVTFEWRFGDRGWRRIGKVWIRWTLHQITRCQLFRNGDIVFYTQQVYQFNNWFTPHAIGVSKGDNANYRILYENTPPPQGQCWLFALRKWVDPEPSVTLGNERRLYNAARDVTSLTGTPDDEKLFAGTSPDGWVFASTDGKIWTRTKATFSEDGTWGLAAEKNGTVCAGTASNAVIYRSYDDGASWESLQQISGATNVPSFCRRRSGEWFAVANNGLLLYAPQLGWETKDVSTAPPGAAYCLTHAFRRIRYSFTNNTIQRQCDGQIEILARNIDRFDLTYYDRNLLIFTPVSQTERDKVSVIRVSYSVRRKDRVLRRQSAVVLRGLP